VAGSYTNKPVARILAAGTKDNMSQAVEIISRLNAIHFNDYEGHEDGLGLGTPLEAAESLGRDLSTMRSIAESMEVDGAGNMLSLPAARRALADDVPSMVEGAVALMDEADAIVSELSALDERIDALRAVESLAIEVDLLDGYTHLTSFVGTVNKVASAKNALAGFGKGALVFGSSTGAKPTIAAFCRNEDAAEVQTLLAEEGFAALPVPEGEGLPDAQLKKLSKERKALEERGAANNDAQQTWSVDHGGIFIGGLEVLERDFMQATAPVKMAVSDHAFLLDGWILAEDVEGVTHALSKVCAHVETEVAHAHAHTGHHDDHDHGHAEPAPPIALGDHNFSKPMELITDAVGRSEYGKIDPTVFMLITYPIFFGIMLGDMMYGLMTLGLAGIMWSKFKDSDNEFGQLGAKLIAYIGLATVMFGYIYGEFAGFEFLPHGHCTDGITVGVQQCIAAGGQYEFAEAHAPAWVSWMTALYPMGGELHHVINLKFGLTLAYPFHRVTLNMTDLIILTIYMGVAHLLVAYVLGIFDEMRAGHGWQGALYGKVSWMCVLIGGFLFCYQFLVRPGHTDPSYLDILDTMMYVGGGLVLTGIGLLMVHLMHDGVPFGVTLILGPIEAIGLLPSTLSYVRLFAVGIVGVKIAYAGNMMLYDGAVAQFAAGGAGYLVGAIMVVAWLGVQLFAWGLGVFSPNIHAARLHFVEWMRQFYSANGEAFSAFGFRAKHVEVE